jgi:hypothetical protein
MLTGLGGNKRFCLAIGSISQSGKLTSISGYNSSYVRLLMLGKQGRRRPVGVGLSTLRISLSRFLLTEFWQGAFGAPWRSRVTISESTY